MLQIPQHREASATPAAIPLPESSEILERGLRLISSKPIAPETFSTITSIEESANFCDKYGMHGGLSFLRIVAKADQFCAQEPLRLYKLACTYEWRDIIDKTALHCIRDDPSSPAVFEAFRDRPVDDYVRLVSLAYRRRMAFETAIHSRFLPVTTCSGGNKICRQTSWPAWCDFALSAQLAFIRHPGSAEPNFFDELTGTPKLKIAVLACIDHADFNWKEYLKGFKTLLDALPTV